jgi:hypothetical protein
MTELDHILVEKQPAGKLEEGAGSGVEELRISDLLDFDQLKSLLANCCDSVRIALAIIDFKGINQPLIIRLPIELLLQG